jgi:TrpR-related protein YerC/YecD
MKIKVISLYQSNMGKPQDEIKEKSYYRDIYFLYDALNSLDNIDEVKLFMKDMLTKSELRMLKRRWHIANLLFQGNNIRSVAIEANASTQTVVRLKQILEEGQGGLSLAIQRTHKKIIDQHKKQNNAKRYRGGSKYVKGWFK